jgi:thiamine biosynthesis lipoprotein
MLQPPTPLGGRWQDIELLQDSRVRFRRALRLDLSGIAKGYAVDLAVECLQQHDIERLIVNAGGDLRVAGPDAFEVGVRDPRAPGDIAHTLWLQHGALATSAAYESRRELPQDEQVCALVDVRTGQTYRGHGSISVRAGSCMDADALTKIVLFAPPALAEQVLSHCDARAFALT